MAKISSDLQRQFSEAGPDRPLEMVVRLNPPSGSPAPLPEDTKRIAKELVERVTKASGDQNRSFHVFANLGTFSVSARRLFLETLASQPEVAAVIPNRTSGLTLIAPVAKRPATLKDVKRAVSPSKARPTKRQRLSAKAR